MHLIPRSTVSTLLLAFYLLVAGGLPLADALLDRAGAQAVVDAGQGERERSVPHDESCALCLLLDRVAGAEPAHSGSLVATPASATAAWSTHPETVSAPAALAHSARAPPQH